MIINPFHRVYFNAGIQTVQFLIAQQYWIISFRPSIRRILSKCTNCFKSNPLLFCPVLIGDLPPARISCVKPFLHTIVDYAGPFKVCIRRHRGVKSSKTNLCLFICFATEAIHLELASDLSMHGLFLADLKRFIARRGRCSNLYCDCVTNFVGAHRHLNRMFEKVARDQSISWNFNPASAPHFGGLWKVAIKNVKTHLYRVKGEQTLSFEKLYTVPLRLNLF